MMTTRTIWTFQCKDKNITPEIKRALKKSVRVDRKARFGWSYEDSANLKLPEDQWHPENKNQKELLDIQPGDWIIYLNLPVDKNCLAVKVATNIPQKDLYVFGDKNDSIGGDFRQYIRVIHTVSIEFCYQILPKDLHTKLTLRGRYNKFQHPEFCNMLEHTYLTLYDKDKR